MSEWQEVKLKEICKFKYGTNLPANSRIEGNYPVYGSSSVVSHHIDYYVKGPGIIVGRKGTVGKVQYSPTDFFPIDTTFYIEHNLNKVDLKFLYYRLQISGLDTMNSDAAVPGLNRIAAINQRIELPPLPTQQKIAKILSNYDDLIENNLKRIKLLEESARLAYEELFLHFRIDGKKLDIDAESCLPFGWERKSITSIGDVNKYSISVKTAPKKIKYIDISATETGVYRKPDYLEFKDAPSRARRKLNYGDTIFSTVRPNRKIYALVLEDDPTLIASTGFAVITPKDPLHFPYIYLSLSAQCFIDSAVAVAGGAAYPSINQSSFERLEVTVPPENILNKFCGSASFYLKTKNVLLNQNQLLIKARDILLPRLMTGIIDTDDMDIAA
jgi:type I restriction enzyme S subunit